MALCQPYTFLIELEQYVRNLKHVEVASRIKISYNKYKVLSTVALKSFNIVIRHIKLKMSVLNRYLFIINM